MRSIILEAPVNGGDGWQWLGSGEIPDSVQKATNGRFVFFGSHTYQSVFFRKYGIPDVWCIKEMLREFLASESKAGLVADQLRKVSCNRRRTSPDRSYFEPPAPAPTRLGLSGYFFIASSNPSDTPSAGCP